MSILIKGMKMPEDCNDCFFLGTKCSGEWWCYAVNKHVSVYDGKRNECCPLIEVPPHRDLIDRDAARGSIKPWSPEDERSGCTFDTVKKLMHTMLDRAPIIIKAEEDES